MEKSALEGMRNETEDFVLQRLREVVPAQVRVVVLADRGFGDQKFYALLEQLKFDYVVRGVGLRGTVTARGSTPRVLG